MFYVPNRLKTQSVAEGEGGLRARTDPDFLDVPGLILTGADAIQRMRGRKNE